MFGTTLRTDKLKIDVQVETQNGKKFLGSMFVRRDQRMSDLLNDDRSFLPLETTEGLVVNLNKLTIVYVTQLHQYVDDGRVRDPYEILGVHSQVSNDEIQQIYHLGAKNYHPDVIQSLGLPAEFHDLANTQMARINDAYERIERERQSDT